MKNCQEKPIELELHKDGAQINIIIYCLQQHDLIIHVNELIRSGKVKVNDAIVWDFKKVFLPNQTLAIELQDELFEVQLLEYKD